MCLFGSYPAVWVVADTFSDDAIARTAPQFLSNRLPIVTWKHPKSNAVLLRSASFVSHIITKKKSSILVPHGAKHTPDKPPELDAQGIFSADVEAFISTIVNACPSVERETEMSNSLSRDVSMPPTSMTFAAEEILAQYRPQNANKSLTSQVSMDSLDMEVRGIKNNPPMQEDNTLMNWDDLSTLPKYVRGISSMEDEQPMTMASNVDGSLFPNTSIMPDHGYTPVSASLYPMTSMDVDDENSIQFINEGVVYNRTSSPTDNNFPDLGVDEIAPEESLVRGSSQSGDVIGRDICHKKRRHNGHISFASLPTNPRDWVVMDVLPEELSKWTTQELYIIGDRTVLQHVSTDVYPNCTLIPVEVSIVSFLHCTCISLYSHDSICMFELLRCTVVFQGGVF